MWRSHFLSYLTLINKYTLFINAIIPEKNSTISHCARFKATVWNIVLKNGTYKTPKIKTIDTNTAPTSHGLVNNFISNIECLSDLHSKT